MKQILTPEDINFLETTLSKASKAPWAVVSEDGVDTAWVTHLSSKPVALIDYSDGNQNKYDAELIVASRNYFEVMLNEIKNLRKRILELIQSNNLELQKRLDMQTALEELKEIVRHTNEPS